MFCRSLATVFIAFVPLHAIAQTADPGRDEYMVACAVCHGESGMGDGPMAGLLNIETPNLTTLSGGEDGGFPYQKMIEVIDGRNEIRAHGSSMPVWGTRFFVTAATSDGFDPVQADLVARGRVLSLVEYLRSIQG